MKSGRSLWYDAFAADRAHQVHAHRVAAEREEEAVPERQDAGVAPDQIHGERDDRVAHDLADQRDQVLGDMQAAVLRHCEVRSGNEHEQRQCGSRKRSQPAGGEQRQQYGLAGVTSLMPPPRGPSARTCPADASE